MFGDIKRWLTLRGLTLDANLITANVTLNLGLSESYNNHVTMDFKCLGSKSLRGALPNSVYGLSISSIRPSHYSNVGRLSLLGNESVPKPKGWKERFCSNISRLK